jgi:hypothetical protein
MNLWFTAVLVLLSTIVFLTAYLILSQSIAAEDREVIRAQLEVYRAWYQEGGLSALNQHFLQRDDSGKEYFFVRVAGTENTGMFISVPRPSDQFDVSALPNIAAKKPLSWLTLPAENHSTDWLCAIARR